MFILTIDSKDKNVISQILKEVAKHILKYDNCVSDLNIQNKLIKYEYDNLTKQDWLYMAEFLTFNPDGNTLKNNSLKK